VKRLLAIAALALIPISNARAQNKWIEAYYPNWQEGGYPINRIDYTALTHIVLAHWLSNSNGTIGSSGWDSACSSVVTPAHAAGAKVLMMLGGSDDVNLATAASPATQATLISSIQSKVSACGMDGVDLDWEVNVNPTNFISLAKNLRAAAPSMVITAPIDAGVQPSSLAAGLAAYIDHVSMMTYGWQSWNGTSGYFASLPGIKTNVSNWEAAGTPAAKIGVGVGFYAVTYQGGVNGPNQSMTGSSVVGGELPYGWSLNNGGGVLSCYYNQSTGTYHYDPSPSLNSSASNPPQQPEISIPSGLVASTCSGGSITWVTYEDEASVAAKAAYVNSAGLGGVIIWTLSEGATDPVIGRNPLVDVLKLKLLGSGPAPMPVLATSGATSVGGPTTITLTGLPGNLTQIEANWSNYTSGVAWDDTTDTGFPTYGQPSEYYIEGSTNGSTWNQLTHITGEHYTGRQFVFDLTGTGYTQVRMRIISIVGSNSGYDTFTVHNAANNSTDTYLLLGDSITANCWVTGATEQLGTQIHAARPNRFPVHTEGGQSGFLSSTALDTTKYGKPAVQQWLSDMPGVKYVGLSMGTNDANGNIPAATYCANMQSLAQYVIAAGKVPIIPTIVASPSAAVQANAPAMNACLATLEQNYPSIVIGPDLWTLFYGHSVADGWFFDSLHPSLGTGCTALQNAWVNTLLAAIYPSGGGSGTAPNPPTNLQVISVQ